MITDFLKYYYDIIARWWISHNIDIIWLIIVKNIIIGAVLAGFISVIVMILIWLERKIGGHFQSRMGPMRTGSFHGWSQSIADAIKLLEKEDIVPKKADRWIFNIAPYIIFLPVLMVLIVIPYGERLIPKDLNIGILYILAVSSLAVVAILMGGYSSNNKYSLLGALRSVSQLISYEIPLVLSILGVVLIAGTMSMGGIVEAQRNMWYIVYQPVGFLIYLISATAEVNRTPFDLPEAEQEIVAGYATEYSGMKFAMFFLAEFGNAFIVSAIATTLFLGGWLGPFLPGFVWFFIKTFAVIFILMWFRWTFPRFRLDQLTDLGWKVLVPLGFINLLGTAFLILYV